MDPNDIVALNDKDVFAVISRFGSVTFWFDEESALDSMTRTDKICQGKMIDWKEYFPT